MRGIAALSVVLFHYTYGYDNGIHQLSNDKFYFTYGNLGVHLFFIISGFVIFMTLSNSKKSVDFWVSRFSRLYPAYWTAILVSLAITNFLPNPFHDDQHSLSEVLVNFTMLQHWFKIKDIDGAYWTLSVELTFYFLIWLIYASKQLKNIYIFLIIWLSLEACALLFTIPFENYLNQIFILQYCPLFIAGICFYKIKHEQVSFVSILLVVLSFFIEAAQTYVLMNNFIPIFIIFLFYLWFLLFSLNVFKDRSVPILNFFGYISYALYLIHENIGLAIIYNLKKISDHQIFYIPITSAIVIFLAAILTYFVEQPLMKFIKTSYKKNYNK